MNIRCPGCNATLKYSPDLGKMYCAFCGNTYDVEELQNSSDDVLKIHKRNYDTIKMQMVHCTSCGAELAMNEVEISSYCAYCGQPTIVKDRIDNYLKPDFIIPFKITKQRAVEVLKHDLKNGYFVPNALQNIELDRLCGIYVPFWLYNVYCEDEQVWVQTDKNDKNRVVQYLIRVANAHFNHFTVDGSERLIDESTQRLEPFYMKELTTFDPSYLSGFYSDRFDTPEEAAKTTAKLRIEDMMYDKIKKTMPANTKIQSRNPKVLFEREQYALLPVWFLTFRYNETPYTILVNGQTGKMVGAFPYSKKKVTAFFITFAILLSLIGAKFFLDCPFMFESHLLACSITGILVLGKIAYSRFKRLLQSIDLTTSTITRDFVKERQEI